MKTRQERSLDRRDLELEPVAGLSCFVADPPNFAVVSNLNLDLRAEIGDVAAGVFADVLGHRGLSPNVFVLLARDAVLYGDHMTTISARIVFLPSRAVRAAPEMVDLRGAPRVALTWRLTAPRTNPPPNT